MGPVAGGGGVGWSYESNFLLREKKMLLFLHVCQCCGVVDISSRCQINGIIFWGGGRCF